MKNPMLWTMIVLVIVGFSTLSPAVSLFNFSVTIQSSGSISGATRAPVVYNSEIRGVFFHSADFNFPIDWTVVADTLVSHKINAVYGEFLGFGEGYYGSSPYGDQLGLAIAACHARGISVYADMTFFYHHVDVTYSAVKSSGVPYEDWVCPTKQAVRAVIKAQVEYVASNYDIDGFMFDYIRYDSDDMCYCSECRAKFETWLGEDTITDWSAFYPGGSRQNEFLEWRVTPVTEMVRDVRGWMLAAKPNLKFAVACFTIFQSAPTYWRYWIGQDTTDWVAKGYVDMVAPMMYTSDTQKIEDYIQSDFIYMVGGKEGKIPLIPFITTGIESAVSVAEFEAVVNQVRKSGADGWVIWRYGGPGVDCRGYLINTEPYLQAITLPSTFSLTNIQVTAGETEAIVNWTTELSATGELEYRTFPLFSASYSVGYEGFHYWDINHIPGTVIANTTPSITHIIKITGLAPDTTYYFRVKSQDASGTATSEMRTFTTT